MACVLTLQLLYNSNIQCCHVCRNTCHIEKYEKPRRT